MKCSSITCACRSTIWWGSSTPAGAPRAAAGEVRRPDRAAEDRLAVDRRAGAPAQRVSQLGQDPARRCARARGLDLEALLEPGRPGAGSRRHRGDRPLFAARRRVVVGAGRWPVGVLRAAGPRERHPRGYVGDPPQHPRRTRPRPAEGLSAGAGAVATRPETRYARNGDVNIAYQVFGDGPRDLVFVPGWVSNVEYFWEEPSVVRFFERLAAFSRLILFDKRGTGLSDRVDRSEE